MIVCSDVQTNKSTCLHNSSPRHPPKPNIFRDQHLHGHYTVLLSVCKLTFCGNALYVVPDRTEATLQREYKHLCIYGSTNKKTEHSYTFDPDMFSMIPGMFYKFPYFNTFDSNE